ncbi:hypothetical protein ALP66_00940, partial [Pseudomonas amygdali pv. photiniae]
QRLPSALVFVSHASTFYALKELLWVVYIEPTPNKNILKKPKNPHA